MRSFEDWLERKPAGPKPRKPLKRTALKRSTKRLNRTQVRRVSKKHARELREYQKVRVEYLAEHAACEAGPIILAARLPVAYQVPRCGVWSNQVHHTARRGPNLLNKDTFCACCPDCHRWIETHAQKSRELGLLV